MVCVPDEVTDDALTSRYGIAVAIARRNLCNRNIRHGGGRRGGGHLGGFSYLLFSTMYDSVTRGCVRFCVNYSRAGPTHWIELIVNRRCGAGEIVDLVHFNVERECNMVSQRLERRVSQQVLDIVPSAREEVVHTHHVTAVSEQPFTKM
jgi:hypothetical protein